MLKDRIMELGPKAIVSNIFKDIVHEDSEEPSDRDRSSQSSGEDFYEKLSDTEH